MGNTITTRELRKDLSDHLGRVKHTGERNIISRNGKPVAALVPVDDLELLEWLEDQIDIVAAQEAIAEGGERISLRDYIAGRDDVRSPTEQKGAKATR